MRKAILFALCSAVLAACSLTPSNTQPPSGVLGTLELQFGSSNDPIFQAAQRIRPAALTPFPDSSISANFVSFVTRDNGTVRTLTAVYDITNTSTTTTFQNLSLVAYVKDGNSNSSALKNINTFAGTPSSTDVYGVTPAHGTNGSVAVSEFNSDLQVYTQSESTNFTSDAQTSGAMTASEYALEYGFVVRQSGSSHLRSIAPGATGRVSLSMKIPVSTDVSSGSRFTMTFVVADNDAAHVVQSLEEPVAGADAITRAAAVGAGTQVRILPTSTSSATPKLLLNPRTAGTTATPLGRLFTGQLVYTQLGINEAIPDGSQINFNQPGTYGTAVTRTFNVPAIAGSARKITLRVRVTHTWRGDVRVRLTSPSSTEREIFKFFPNDNSLNGNNINATLDNAATNTIVGLCGNTTNDSCVGLVKPFEPLSDFNGQNIAGNWVVRVDDGYAQDTGTLDELELVITVAP
jgi:subtilisin-like proprotein convertase family protein